MKTPSADAVTIMVSLSGTESANAVGCHGGGDGGGGGFVRDSRGGGGLDLVAVRGRERKGQEARRRNGVREGEEKVSPRAT